jgi:AcrR family transcriptional regulator
VSPPANRPASRSVGDLSRTRIIDAARELFGNQGFDSTTVRQIAEKAGLTDAALYYHFKSKREILAALWDIPTGADVAGLRPEAPLTSERLNQIVDATLEFGVANDHYLRLMVREILGGDQIAVALRQQNRAFLRRTFCEHLATVFPAPEAEIKTEAIIALLFGVSVRLQIEAGGDFSRASSSPEFRDRVHRWVATLARLEEAGAGVAPCAP